MRQAATTRRCLRCRTPKAVAAFPERGVPKDKHGPSLKPRGSVVCWECLETEAATIEARKVARRATWTDPETGIVMRRCSQCRVVKQLYRDFYSKGMACPNSRHPATGPCKVCHDAKTTAYHQQKPDEVRAWRREATKRYHRRIMSNPKTHAQYREDERLRRHMKAEREGRTLRRIAPRIVQPTSPSYLPAQPLAAFVDARAAGDEDTCVDVCAELGVNARTHREWRKAGKVVRVGTAERVFMNAGVDWTEVYSYDDYAHIFLAREVVAVA